MSGSRHGIIAVFNGLFDDGVDPRLTLSHCANKSSCTPKQAIQSDGPGGTSSGFLVHGVVLLKVKL